MSDKSSVSIDVTAIFERSKKEKIEDLRVALEKYKISQGDKINIEFLSPASRQLKLRQIDQDLADYYEKHRGASTERDKNGQDGVLGAKSERERMAAALGVFSLDDYNIVGDTVAEAEAYVSNRAAFLNRRSSKDKDNLTDFSPTMRLARSNTYIQKRLNYPKMSELGGVALRIHDNESHMILLQKHNLAFRKAMEAQLRKAELTEEQRQQAIAYLAKWEVFRQQREQYADKVEKILKDRIRIRCLLTIIKVS